MKEFFLILFFSKTVLLTPEPINLHGQLELVPDKPLKAITSGASIQIDVSSIVVWSGKEDILTFRERIYELFPKGVIKAKLVGEGDKEVKLSYVGSGFNKESVYLSLDAEPPGVHTDIEFKKVIIESSIELNGVKILWKNYKH